MILAAPILQATAPQSAVDAERAFNAAAQAKGQWTAFREFAAADAVMFRPQPTNAQAWLKGRSDPPKSVEWWPTESYVSCDGRLAVNTGGWKRPDGSVGYFTTVWRKDADGSWKWIVDGGDALKAARQRPTEPKVISSNQCSVPASSRDEVGIMCVDAHCEDGKSGDGTLAWQWFVTREGRRTFEVFLWTGSKYERVIEDQIAAPAR
jgi:ketosteroid isomerase-like protein